MNRRTFLKGTATVAAATALPFPVLASMRQSTGANQGAQSNELKDGWEFYRGPLDARFQVWHSQELLTWEKVSLPHCVNHYDACDPDVPAYRGQSWYRLKVPVANPYTNGRTLLHFEGVGQQSQVWIGDKMVGSHMGGYDEFVIDITDACKAWPAGQPLELAVLADNGRNVERLPSDLSDFTLYGGIYRPLHLVYVPAVSLEAVHTVPTFEPGGPAHISVTTRLYAPATDAKTANLTIELFDPTGKQIHSQKIKRSLWQGETELANVTIAKPHTWSPSSPQLYRCVVTVESAGASATSEHKFGIRHTRWEEHGPFYLNGERLLLRGTHRHEDHAWYAAAMPADLVRQEMHLMRQMGANMVRLAHYQQRRLVLDLCDELGIFVWEELAWCRSGVGDETFQQMGKRLLTNMIDQHRNHPAVLIWSLGNEDDWPTELNGKDHEAIRRYMTELRDLSHQLDPTRMTGFRRCDFAKDIPDVYSPSIWAGWYSGSYTEYAGALEKWRYQVKHFLHVEWGADSHAGRYTEDADAVLSQISTNEEVAEKGFAYKMTGGPARVSKDGSWSETYACDLFDWYLKTLEATPWLTGALQWIFKDFTTPLRVDNPVPRVNQKGLLERDMTLKEGYFVFQSYWADKPMLHIFGHNWPIRWGKSGQERLVRVYSNCAEVELFLNGKSVGTRKRNSQDFPCAGLRWKIAFHEGQNELKAIARHNGQELTDSITFHYETRSWGEPAKLNLTQLRKTDQGTTVQAELVDAAGVRCLDSRAQVRFEVAGDATMIDNLGTPTGSRVVQVYNGRAELTLKTTGVAVVSVSTANLTPAFLNLQGA